MSIWTNPYPFDGEDECPTVHDAATVINVARSIDGEEFIKSFKNLMSFTESVERDGKPWIQIKSQVGINKVRREVGRLWRCMSKDAKVWFLCLQLLGAKNYLSSCVDNMERIIGEDPRLEKMKDLPSPLSFMNDKY